MLRRGMAQERPAQLKAASGNRPGSLDTSAQRRAFPFLCQAAASSLHGPAARRRATSPTWSPPAPGATACPPDRHELLVAALLHHMPVAQHHDAVAAAYRAQPVRDKQSRAACRAKAGPRGGSRGGSSNRARARGQGSELACVWGKVLMLLGFA